MEKRGPVLFGSISFAIGETTGVRKQGVWIMGLVFASTPHLGQSVLGDKPSTIMQSLV